VWCGFDVYVCKFTFVDFAHFVYFGAYAFAYGFDEDFGFFAFAAVDFASAHLDEWHVCAEFA